MRVYRVEIKVKGEAFTRLYPDLPARDADQALAIANQAYAKDLGPHTAVITRVR